MLPKAFLSWSSGKDGAFALMQARRLGLVEVVGVLTTISETYDRVIMHGVRHSILDRQVAALGLPCLKVPLPLHCTMAVYEAHLERAMATMKAQGVRHIIYGDLFLESVRCSREKQLARAGMQGVFPLWKRDTSALAHDMIASGLVANIVCLDATRLDRRFAGRRFDHDFLTDLPFGVDPCGENGEFHTVVSAGPMFHEPIPLAIGEIIERDGFIFADAFHQSDVGRHS
jgi:uncharacterized protein (TIGR00290 family)